MQQNQPSLFDLLLEESGPWEALEAEQQLQTIEILARLIANDPSQHFVGASQTAPKCCPRGARQSARRSRRNLYSVGPMREPDHEAVIRFGGEAPRRRAHSNVRFNDHAETRVTTTSDRERPAGQDRSPPGVPKLCVCAPCQRGWSGRFPQLDAVWNFAGSDHVSIGTQKGPPIGVQKGPLSLRIV